MSLVAFAIRIASVRAIRAAIWPEFVVVDSPQSPLDIVEKGNPLIAVYTGHDTGRLEANELLSGERKVSLAIQIYLPPLVTVTVGGQPLSIDTRKAGAETILDVIDRRILGAFTARLEPWSDLRGQFVTATPRVQSISYLVETGDVRTTAREITLECETLYEPMPGAPPEGVWAELIDLMRNDTSEQSVAPLAAWLAAEIQGPQLLTPDERDRIDLGLGAYAARMSSITPIVAGSEVPVAEIDVAEDGSIPLVIASTPAGP